MNIIQEFCKLQGGKIVTVKIENGKVLEFSHYWPIRSYIWTTPTFVKIFTDNVYDFLDDFILFLDNKEISFEQKLL